MPGRRPLAELGFGSHGQVLKHHEFPQPSQLRWCRDFISNLYWQLEQSLSRLVSCCSINHFHCAYIFDGRTSTLHSGKQHSISPMSETGLLTYSTPYLPKQDLTLRPPRPPQQQLLPRHHPLPPHHPQQHLPPHHPQ
jgi:hypothetical protein